jgi:hypothetical protein
LGIALKQVVSYFGITIINFQLVLPMLGTLGLILIVFEGALELKYSTDKNAIIKRSFLSALTILLVSAALITYIIQYLTHQDFYRCLANAIPFCVVSSAIAIPSASNISAAKKEFIIYESSFSDILAVILFNFVISNREFNVGAFAGLGVELFIILLFALGACIFLLYIIGRIKHRVKFFLIISLLTLVYAIGQSYHLSSLIIVLALGLFLNNADQIKSAWFKKYFIYKGLPVDLKQLFQLSAESAFLLRTFFFVIFGFSMDVYQLQKWSLLVSGGIILLAIYVVRFIYIRFVSKTDLLPELFLVPRGLISVLLYYNLPKDLRIAGVETGLLFMVVLGTSIFMSLGLLASRQKA